MVIYNYVTTNTLNGKQYVGMHSTDNIDDGYLGSGRAFLRAVKKYGKENFTREIIEFCYDVSVAFANEEKYIAEYNTLQPNGYNLSPTGGTLCKGKHSEESIKKMVEAKKNISEETKKKLSIVNTGKKLSKKHKDKISNTLINKMKNMEDEIKKELFGKINVGKKHSEETRRKIGEGLKKGMNKERRKNIGLCFKGKKQKILKCPYCGKEGGNSMKRWHFDNCKQKPVQ